MPDPIDELDNFSVPPLTPLPPSEVRRRGDHLRRRRHALVAAGSVAVVAIIAAPLAVLAQHEDPAQPQPMPAPSWTTQIPDAFDLTAVPAGSQVAFTARPGSAFDDVPLCDGPAFPTGAATDVAGATYAEPGTESSGARTLAVYADDDAASQALAALRSGVADCPEDEVGGTTYLWGVVDAPTVADESLVVSQQVAFDATLVSDLTLVEVVREGNALLLASTHTSAGGDQAVEETLPALTDLTAPVVEQLCVFSPEGCP